MFSIFFEFTSIILVLGIVGGAQSKDCFICEGINCLKSSKISNKGTCTDPMDNCVTVFEGSTVIARGCYSSLAEKHRSKCDDMFGSECHKCYQNLCNDKGAISCIQCNSKNNPDCAVGPLKIESSRCPVSTSTITYCFTRKSSEKIERGCLIDTKEQVECLADSSCNMCIANCEVSFNSESNDEVSSGSKCITTHGKLFLAVWFILAFLSKQ